MILGLWPEWKPTPQTIKWLWDRWEGLYQDKLQDAIKQHRMEAAAEKAGRPVYNRINDLYIERTQQKQMLVQTRKVIDRAQPPTDAELAEWDRWAAEIMITATPEEIRLARQRFPFLNRERTLAIAVDFLRRKRKEI
jgi:hypothetical protein